MQIEQSLIDEIIRRNDIVEVIGKSIKLKKSGANYFACCPFHNEKSPSFSINVNKQFFHCFGCGESGNVITFIMKYQGLEFIEAVRLLANNAGIHIPENTNVITKEQAKERKIHKASLEDTINRVVQFYRNNLVNSSVASHYLVNRGLTNEIVQQFLLGYSLNQPNSLATLFNDYENNKFLIDSGLVVKNDNGKLYDRFRDRIIFPIRDVRGNVIAFGGRVIAHGEPKYLNSPETELFNKSLELYGLFEAQKQIRDKNNAIVVEGYMDVIAMYQFGIENVVASMGTAATQDQIKKLFRICDDIYFCFDGDKAGQKAAWRALERSISLVTDSKTVNFIFLPEDEDPDSYLRKKGVIEFENYRKHHSLSMSDFLLKQLSQEVNTNSNEGKAKLISLAKPYIEQMTAVALQVMLKKQLASLVELEANVLESILNNRSKYAFYTQKFNKDTLPEKTRMPTINNVNKIIQTALKNIAWVISYKLPEPEEIDSLNEKKSLSREILDLMIFLDFIQCNYDEGETIDISYVKQNIECPSLNLDTIIAKQDFLELTQQDFIQHLDIILRRIKHKATKIPRISMEG